MRRSLQPPAKTNCIPRFHSTSGASYAKVHQHLSSSVVRRRVLRWKGPALPDLQMIQERELRAQARPAPPALSTTDDHPTFLEPDEPEAVESAPARATPRAAAETPPAKTTPATGALFDERVQLAAARLSEAEAALRAHTAAKALEAARLGDDWPTSVARTTVHAVEEERLQRARDDAVRGYAAAVPAAWNTRRQEAINRIPDWAAVAEHPDLPIPPAVGEALLSAPNGPDVAYYLGRNPDKAKEISKMPPGKAAMEVGKISALLERGTSPPSAPRPARTAPPGRPRLAPAEPAPPQTAQAAFEAGGTEGYAAHRAAARRPAEPERRPPSLERALAYGGVEGYARVRAQMRSGK
jgi:hypothetical protein